MRGALALTLQNMQHAKWTIPQAWDGARGGGGGMTYKCDEVSELMSDNSAALDSCNFHGRELQFSPEKSSGNG